jgi:hypothetical protein
MPLLKLGALGAMAFWSVACSGARSVACASDLDCGASTACDQGQCINPRAATPPDLRPRRVALHPHDDASVLSSTCCQTTSYGAQDLLVVGGSGGSQVYRSFLRFHLPRLQGEKVVAAHLRLVTRPRWCDGDEPLEILAFATSNVWNQADLTWISQPEGEGSPVGRVVVRPTHSGETVIDLTRLVKRWSATPSDAHGLLLRASQERTNLRIAWFSKESSDERLRPRLDIEVQ